MLITITLQDLYTLLNLERRLSQFEHKQLVIINLLGQMKTGIQQVQQSEVAMHKELSDIQAEVQKNTSAVDSSVVLLTNLSALLKQHQNDPAKIDEIADQLAANSKRLADAIVANTPVVPDPEPTPDPVPTPDPTQASGQTP